MVSEIKAAQTPQVNAHRGGRGQRQDGIEVEVGRADGAAVRAVSRVGLS